MVMLSPPVCYRVPKQSETNEEFGRLLSALMEERGWSSNGELVYHLPRRLDQSYVSRMRKGRIPSYDVLLNLLEVFGREKAAPLFRAAGKPLPAIDLPRGVYPLSEPNEQPFYRPNTVPAGEWGGTGDPDSDGVAFTREARRRGAEYVREVYGQCLEPYYMDGDLVALKPASRDQVKQDDVVLVHRDGEWSLKIKTRRNKADWWGTANEERWPGFGARDDDEVFGVVVGMYRPNLPKIPRR